MNKLIVINRLLLSMAIFALALSIAYFSWVLNSVHHSMPVLVKQVSAVTESINFAAKQVHLVLQKADSTLIEVKHFNALIPQVLEESSKIRGEVNYLVTEASYFRQEVPNILAESKSIRKVLPSVLAEVKATRITVQNTVDEAHELRASLPELMAEVDILMDKAKDMGIEAGEGAVSGVFTGLLKAPYAIVRNMTLSVVGGDRELTPKERKLLVDRVGKLLQSDTVGEQVKFDDRATKMKGFVALTAVSRSPKYDCKDVRVVIGREHDQVITLCRENGGHWSIKSLTQEAR